MLEFLAFPSNYSLISAALNSFQNHYKTTKKRRSKFVGIFILQQQLSNIIAPLTGISWGPCFICPSLFSPRSPCCGSCPWRRVWSWLWRTSSGKGRTACRGLSPRSTSCPSFHWPTLWWAWPTPPSSESTWRKHQPGNKHAQVTDYVDGNQKLKGMIIFFFLLLLLLLLW